MFSERIRTINTPINTPGRLIGLSQGLTHYELSGPAKGQGVVLIHGIASPYFVWDKTVPALVKAGQRVLRYDLYGRGYSSKPDTAYSGQLFTQQLLELLLALNITKPVDLVGISLGGLIVPLFAAQYPGLVRRIALIAPAGVGMKKPLLARLVTMPQLGEFIVDKFGEAFLQAGIPKMFCNPRYASDFLSKATHHYQDKHFRRAYLSTLRHLAFVNITDTFRQIARQGHPTLLIWGRADKTVPFENHRLIKALIPNAQFHAIDEANHIPPYEKPEEINPLLVNFLQQENCTLTSTTLKNPG